MKRETFNKYFALVVTLKQIDFNKIQSEMLFSFIESDFNDEDFALICIMIIKNSNLYGKYPDPSLFYEKKEELFQIRFFENEKFRPIKQKYLKLENKSETIGLPEKN